MAIAAWETEITKCKDGDGCEHVTNNKGSLCKRFPALKKQCPFSCKSCECKDTKDCQDVNQKACDEMPQVFHKTCAKTCKVCGNK